MKRCSKYSEFFLEKRPLWLPLFFRSFLRSLFCPNTDTFYVVTIFTTLCVLIFVGDIWFQKSSYNNQLIHLLIDWLVFMWSKFWNWAVFVKVIDRKIKRFFAVELFFIMFWFCSALKFFSTRIRVKSRTSESFDSLYHSKQQTAQQTSACSKTTIETLEKGVKHV